MFSTRATRSSNLRALSSASCLNLMGKFPDTQARAIALSCVSGVLPSRFKKESLDNAARFEDRATQVENMRCETCERYVSGEDDEACTFNQIEYQGPGFGCFVHKPKELTDESRRMD